MLKKISPRAAAMRAAPVLMTAALKTAGAAAPALKAAVLKAPALKTAGLKTAGLAASPALAADCAGLAALSRRGVDVARPEAQPAGTLPPDPASAMTRAAPAGIRDVAAPMPAAPGGAPREAPTQSDLSVAAAGATRRCDAAGGLADGIVAKPCDFAPPSLLEDRRAGGAAPEATRARPRRRGGRCRSAPIPPGPPVRAAIRMRSGASPA